MEKEILLSKRLILVEFFELFKKEFTDDDLVKLVSTFSRELEKRHTEKE